MPDPEVFPLQTKQAARAKRIRVLQHMFAALLLIGAGANRMQHGGELLSVFEIAAGTLLIAAVIYERVRHHHIGVAWVEFAGAAMTLVEAFGKLEERHHLSFYVLSFITPAILFTLAVFDAEMAALRRLKIDERGFEMRQRTFFPRRIAWAGVQSWSRTTDGIRFQLRDGREKTFSFRNVINRDEALSWAERALAAHPLPGGDGDAGDREQHEEFVARERRPE